MPVSLPHLTPGAPTQTLAHSEEDRDYQSLCTDQGLDQAWSFLPLPGEEGFEICDRDVVLLKAATGAGVGHP